jgi:aminoglycoside phosphotransferase (APT) family kinase protein
MRRIDGDAPPDLPPYVFEGWVLDAQPEQRRRLQDASVSILARLHEITPATHDLSFLTLPKHGATALDQQLGYQRWYYEWARNGVSYPLIERTLAWLDANRPTEGETVLNWGDARIGNMLYRDFEPAAVLDWEMATLGDPLSDLGLFLVYWGRDQNTLAGDDPAMGTSAGFLSRAEVAERYANASGRDVSQLDFYEMLASYKLAIILAGIHARYLMGKTVGEGFDHIGVMVETIANAALEAGNRSEIAALRG